MCPRCIERRAQALRPTAAKTPEAILLAAVTRLEIHHASRPCPRLRGEIAVHYLLLADHPAVAPQLGLAATYRRLASIWMHSPEPAASAKTALLHS